MQYDDMIIEALKAPDDMARNPDVDQFTARVLSSPAGDMSTEEMVLFAFNWRELQQRINKIDGRRMERADLIEFGRTLAEWLLPSTREGATTSIREIFEKSLSLVRRDGKGLRLCLRLDPALAWIPWEYLYLDRPGGGNGMDGFLALHPRVAIVRYEALALETPPLPKPKPGLKVVVALAQAPDLKPLDLERELNVLKSAFKDQSGIEEIFLKQATTDAILDAIRDADVFHYAGHASFTVLPDSPRTYFGIGALALADRRLNAEDLALSLRGNGVQLAVLGGCETGRRGAANVLNEWGGIAPMLIKAEIPAVIANQFNISDKCAIAFSQHMYMALVAGETIERAVAAGRLGAYLANSQERDWGVPVLYMRFANGQLFTGAEESRVRQIASNVVERLLTTEVRRLDAAMPSITAVQRPTEVWVQICLQNSPGFRDTLPRYTKSGEEIALPDVHGEPISVLFPLDSNSGELLPAKLRVELRAPDFTIDDPCQDTLLLPRTDSAQIRFSLTPKHASDHSFVQVTIKQSMPDGTIGTIGSATITTSILPKSARILKDAVWRIVSLPLSFFAASHTVGLIPKADALPTPPSYTRGLEPSKREEIEDYLALDESWLYSLIPPQLEKYKMYHYSPDGQTKAGREEFEALHDVIVQKLCKEWDLCKKMDEFTNEVDLVAAIAEVIEPIISEASPILIAAIIIKIGPRTFCSCT